MLSSRSHFRQCISMEEGRSVVGNYQFFHIGMILKFYVDVNQMLYDLKLAATKSNGIITFFLISPSSLVSVLIPAIIIPLCVTIITALTVVFIYQYRKDTIPDPYIIKDERIHAVSTRKIYQKSKSI